MIADVWTVAWKELKELLFLRGSWRGGFVAMLVVPLFMLGVLIPWQMGRLWVSPLMLLNWAWVPAFLVAAVIADSFAGERERHTLETLLASRLPDRAILFGKFGASVGYGWGLSVLGMLLGLITVNLTHRGGGLILYPANLAVGAVVLILLAAGLMAAVGILVSLRASNVRQAQQTLSIASLVVFFGGIYGFSALPAGFRKQVAVALSTFGYSKVIVLVAAALLIADAVLLAAAMARFQRARLILD